MPYFDPRREARTVAEGTRPLEPEQARAALAEAARRLPHLADLAYAARMIAAPGFGTVAIAPSGTMLYDPQFLGGLAADDRVFVLAHELEHVRRHSHARALTAGYGSNAFNVAHDYVINDALRQCLGREAPAGGLVFAGARHLAAEDLLRGQLDQPGVDPFVWGSPEGAHALGDAELAALATTFGHEASHAGTAQSLPDVLDPPSMRGVVAEDAVLSVVDTDDPEELHRDLVRILGERYGGLPRVRMPSKLELPTFDEPPPWSHVPLEQSASRRSFSRPSRRGVSPDDGLVLAGRVAGPSRITVVLDVSASVIRHQRGLAAVRTDALARGVEVIRVIQCDGQVVGDDELAPDQLHTLAIRGRYSTEVAAPPMLCDNCRRRHGWRLKWMLTDLGPALRRLDLEGCDETVLVITDGYVQIPREPPGFPTLFVVEAENRTFRPSYGVRVELRAAAGEGHR